MFENIFDENAIREIAKEKEKGGEMGGVVEIIEKMGGK